MQYSNKIYNESFSLAFTFKKNLYIFSVLDAFSLCVYLQYLGYFSVFKSHFG